VFRDAWRKRVTLKDGMFVIDAVAHLHDMTDTNIVGTQGRQAASNLANYAARFSKGPTYPVRRTLMGERVPPEEAYRILFEEAGTDMAVAMAVPLLGFWKNGFAPAEPQYRFKEMFPDRVLFVGGVDPLYDGVEAAVAELERQVTDWGAVGMKFYQAHPRGLSWRADDRRLAYPMWEKCVELGITNVQFHKGAPFGNEHVEDLRPNDIQDAATDFPELTFVIHHFGVPYVDETMSIAARNPNVWLALSAWINQYPVMPMECLHQIGKALFHVGPERLFYGSEAFVWPNLQAYIDLFATMQIPEELQEGYGYPEITPEARRMILGENSARLLGIDIEAKRKQLYGEPAGDQHDTLAGRAS
jgi:predicted TIM-barrel fold metal-dependent hydrolase